MLLFLSLSPKLILAIIHQPSIKQWIMTRDMAEKGDSWDKNNQLFIWEWHSPILGEPSIYKQLFDSSIPHFQSCWPSRRWYVPQMEPCVRITATIARIRPYVAYPAFYPRWGVFRKPYTCFCKTKSRADILYLYIISMLYQTSRDLQLLSLLSMIDSLLFLTCATCGLWFFLPVNNRITSSALISEAFLSTSTKKSEPCDTMLCIYRHHVAM